MRNKKETGLIINVELSEQESKDFKNVKRKLGTRLNSETIRVLIRRAIRGSI
ncbi:MAG: hypothetical protein ACFE9L_08995 [Candidatus Hodarchaeota archaeon]